MSNGLARETYLTWVEIDLEAVRQNYRKVRQRIAGQAAYFAVVKADAYGHGAVPVAQTLQECGADMLCVARVEEAVELREAGIGAPIMVFGPPFEPQAKVTLAADASMTFSEKEHVDAIAAAAKQVGKRAKAHLKIDTGMGRLGCRPENALELLRYAEATGGIELEGVFSHLACSDSDRGQTEKQIATFDDARRAILDAGFSIRYFHLANSGGILDFPHAHYDAVRAGVLSIGLYPGSNMMDRIDVKPAMTLKSRIVLLKRVPAGTGLSYGHAHVTSRETMVATIPMGYADGYPRHASNITSMIVRGKPAKILGRVCMDLILLDVTDIDGVELGDEVIAFGQLDGATLHAEHVAESFGTISYELCTRIGKRVPRFYS